MSRREEHWGDWRSALAWWLVILLSIAAWCGLLLLLRWVVS
jgi:hypothetical protein